jgi:predicted ATPase
VPPLELPAAGDEQPISRLLQNEAVMLFSERAASASGSFELTASNRSAVVALCRRLDGLPFAIELAAVRMRVLTVEQILERLTDRFALLTGGGRTAPAADAADDNRLEPRPADAAGAGAPAPPVRLRRPVHGR